ncbi:MAG: hypothetical protein JW928_07250 [Candidatus Aureabacteria bacterium]|nr:hypothetical protein [Candidatus Auribacterota bacterium]
MKKWILSLFFILFYLHLSGCAPVLVGLGALGGYAISEDELEGIYTIPKDEVFLLGKNVALDWTNDVLEDEGQTEIIATSESRRVWIRIEQLTPDTTRLRVKARKYGFRDINKINTYTLPDIKTAQFIFERIVAPIHKQQKALR